jgi:16S rRNA (uracil1498-N3)-methyltransferase
MHLFYYEESDLLNLFNNGKFIISLSGDEAAHLKVMRLKAGDSVLLSDGVGNIAKAEIEESGGKSTILQLKSVKTFPRPKHYVHIAIAPTKNIARFEWFLEKATEIGIDEITPFYSEHSERIKLREDRLTKVLISAVKQSLKPYMPRINKPIELKTFLNNNKNIENGFIAWLDKSADQNHLKAVCKPNAKATVLIGPEGDFSETEVAYALQQGFKPVSLGSSRLRTETAALVACFTINLLNEPDKSGYPLSIE